MKIYPDDDSVARALVRALRKTGHDVQLPADVGRSGRFDAIQLRHAIQSDRILLSRNYEDFDDLHELLMEGRGHHPGILVIRNDGDRKRDMKPHQIPQAIAKLEASGAPIADQYIILNHWR